MTEQPIKRCSVAFASDDRGCVMLGVALYSLLVSRLPDTRYVIYILDDNISAANKGKMERLAQQHECKLNFIPIHELLSRHIHRHFEQWPPTTYGRLFLPSLLPEEERVIYLDIDLLILSDLGELYDTDLEGALAGAIYEAQNPTTRAWRRRLHIPDPYSYFNAGVLLLELGKMRQAHIEEQLVDYLTEHEHELEFLDQDVLNAVLYAQTKKLHPRWNWYSYHTRYLIQKPHKLQWGDLGSAIASEAAADPAIIHFPGYPKPIHYNSNYYNALYRRYWRESPWADVPRSGAGRAKAFFRRLRYKPIDFLARWRAAQLRRRMLRG